jgi:long-chain fatty acid transport protein
MKRNVIACAVASALGLVANSNADAAGFALHEQGISGLGNAYAGAAAVAEDATTVWWNPAGMSRLPAGKHVSFGGAAIMPSTKFTNRSSVAAFGGRPLGGTGGDAGDSALVPSGFFAMNLNPNWSFGLGVSVPFGLSTSYSPDWIGRFQGIDSEVKTLNINPAVSYKISDSASVGFGISYQRGEIDLLTGTNFLLGEGQSRVSLKDNEAWGFNAGALFNVGTGTRLGVHYRSSVKYGFTGTLQLSGIPAPLVAVTPALQNGDVKLALKTPESLAFSVAHRLNDRWELLADATWTHWDRIQQIPLVRTATGATADTLIFNFEDTWRVSVGANYKLNNAWMLRMGAAYDQSPVPNAQSRTVRLPDNDRYWLSFGAKYQMSPNGALDIGYTYVQVKDTEINNTPVTTPPGSRGTVNGTYKGHVHIIGLQYQHTF